MQLDYLNILTAIKELPFELGRTYLIQFLRGSQVTESKIRKLSSYGSMAYTDAEINDLIDILLSRRMVEQTTNRLGWKVLRITEAGSKAITNPQVKTSMEISEVTEKDKGVFALFGKALAGLDDQQKKALISTRNHILCIAGAGSGKTTVLTRRIEFLVNFRSVDPDKIMAITFTRKARQEMMRRLSQKGINCSIETFNSFCEKQLTMHTAKIYDKPMDVLSNRQRYEIIGMALNSLNTTIHSALETYFTKNQCNGKPNEELIAVLVHDCFFIRDYFKAKNIKLHDFSNTLSKNREAALLIYNICCFIEKYMQENGLRDYTDQLIDTLKLYKDHPRIIPQFEHILVDEFQDVSSTQVQLLEFLNPPNLFCVGDPRQSIFGWRGSDIRYILDFNQKYPDAEVLALINNYRSTKPIVKLINKSISFMHLPDLVSKVEGNKQIKLSNFPTERDEFEFVLDKILQSKLLRSQIFVLARTNRQLSELSDLMKKRSIKHIIRSDERKIQFGNDDELTLATIHAIKGMEAELVFLIGCTTQNFPCRGSEHPVVEMVKVEEYDKFEEEKRLFYVALSRARKTLYLTYTGKSMTHFITSSMLDLIDGTQTRLFPKTKTNSAEIFERLREWRYELSQEHNVEPYKIFHDQTLLEIAESQPLTINELAGIKGIGPTKLRRYGEELLDIINGLN
ncbi:MAG: UvrD-helicase domain-containing protein [Candidatus Woesearchaeota archaeon]